MNKLDLLSENLISIFTLMNVSYLAQVEKKVCSNLLTHSIIQPMYVVKATDINLYY